mgnify:CR=1 FL=1
MEDNVVLETASIDDDGDKERTIAGTLIGGNKPRITEVQNISVEANFSKYMIFQIPKYHDTKLSRFYIEY